MLAALIVYELLALATLHVTILISFPSWTTKDFKANGRLSIGSTGHKNMYIGLSLGGSGLDAKGGIVGGTIELSEINMYRKCNSSASQNFRGTSLSTP